MEMFVRMMHVSDNGDDEPQESGRLKTQGGLESVGRIEKSQGSMKMMYGGTPSQQPLVTILTLIWRLNVRFIPSIIHYIYCQKRCKTLWLCTLNFISNIYGDVDWSAPLVTVSDLALIAVDGKFQNKLKIQDGSSVFTWLIRSLSQTTVCICKICLIQGLWDIFIFIYN